MNTLLLEHPLALVLLPPLPLVLLRLRPLVLLLRLPDGGCDEVPSERFYDHAYNKKLTGCITVHICTSWLQACTQLKLHPL
jgi:hypothetical protein